MSAAAEFNRTQQNQREASDPAASAWVIANAGSGKTHVLTQRVIRLLLAGADPAAILCLTFTKVAAAEMAGRVFGKLGGWATSPAKELKREIEILQGRGPTEEELKRARRLFARALETPGGLKIQTIHAFCERLLHQFPFEANVPGQFVVLDDNSAAALIGDARAKVIERAAAGPPSRLGRAMRRLVETTSDMKLDEALDAVIAGRDRLRRWMDDASAADDIATIDGVLDDLRARLGLVPGETEDAICREICETAHWSGEACGDVAGALASAAGAGQRGVQAVLQEIAAASDPITEAKHRADLFLTGEGDGLKCRQPGNRLGAAILKDRTELKERFAAEAERILALSRRLNLARAYAATEALLVVGDGILQEYQAAKRRAGALDFTDLIARTRNLLSRADASAWVLYKLDRRIDHILVDEAQDTSPDQWSVVKALTEEFFSGKTAVEAERTIFAVGDDKQSIFGFQGAAPHMLSEMRRYFEKKVEDAGRSFVPRPLFLSFRSTREILNAVDNVFGGELAAEITGAQYEDHFSNRDGEPGHVVIMPRIVREKADEPEDWTAPFDAPSAAETVLARSIAAEIGRLRGTVLPSGKTLRDGEILVLVRRRDAFAAAMMRELRRKRIPTAGADRIPIATHIAVQDLLALADVMLLPQDDLQLAACLKSPLVGLDEDALMRLAMNRKSSLWSTLRRAPEAVHRQAYDRLAGWRNLAGEAPFRFFSTVLGPDGARRAFRARLGNEADDVLDTFLSETLAYERIEPPTLQGFVRFIRGNERDIKREADDEAAGVRIMTVHGAKGLEADVVILVDTGGLIVVPGQRDTLVEIGADRDDPAFLWRRLAAEAVPLQDAADRRADRETESEYLRLLYVAMTRARDLLYVAGIKGKKTPEQCWYQRVAEALLPADAARNPEDGELAAPYLWPQPLRAPLPAKAGAAGTDASDAPVPEWIGRELPAPRLAPRPLRPSRALADPDPPLDDFRLSFPQEAPETATLAHGRAVHRLLEVLPGLPAAARQAAAARMLRPELSEDAAAMALQEAEAAIASPWLSGAFGPQSRAEIAIVGRVETEAGPYAVSGRIDRLLRDGDGWHLFDFKTSRAVPPSAAAAPPADILQLALYRRFLAEIEPGLRVSATLVWTAGPNVMPIPGELMERALERLGIRAIAIP